VVCIWTNVVAVQAALYVPTLSRKEGAKISRFPKIWLWWLVID
jgi:hypothetical protein